MPINTTGLRLPTSDLYQVKQNAVGTLNTNQTAIGAIPGEQENFSYDPTGNWTNYTRAENGTEVLDQSRVNNQDNQVTQIDGSSDGIAYDRAGNATKLPPGADGDWSKHFQLKWDGWNRLVEIRDENGVLVAAYAYDGMFRRTTKVVGAETRSYYYNDQWKCVEERSTGSPSSNSSSSSANANSSSSSSNANSPSSSGSSLVVVTSGEAEIQYVWGARPNHRDEMILRDRDTNGNSVLDERLYCLMDYYDPTSIVDTNGDVVERYRFSAFGVRTIFSPTWTERDTSSFDFDFGFHGQFLDTESGYYDYGFRYYSPEMGRWFSRDPIEENGGVNLYGFVGNNLIGTLDKFGLNVPIKDNLKINYSSADVTMINRTKKAAKGGSILGWTEVEGLLDISANWVASDPCTCEFEIKKVDINTTLYIPEPGFKPLPSRFGKWPFVSVSATGVGLVLYHELWHYAHSKRFIELHADQFTQNRKCTYRNAFGYGWGTKLSKKSAIGLQRALKGNIKHIFTTTMKFLRTLFIACFPHTQHYQLKDSSSITVPRIWPSSVRAVMQF